MEYKDILATINSITLEEEEDLEQIDNFLKELGINYTMDLDQAYDSCGYDVWYYAYAFLYDGEVRLITGTYDNY